MARINIVVVKGIIIIIIIIIITYISYNLIN